MPILNQKGIVPLVIILIIAVTIGTGYGVYRSSNQFNIREDKSSEKIGGRLQNKAPDQSKVNLANSNKLAQEAVTLPLEEKKDGEEKVIPQFSITPPAGWDKLPPNGNVILEFLSPTKDTLEEGMAYLDIQPNITVFVAKGDFENLDQARAAYPGKNNEDISSQKITINGQEAIVTRSTKDLADLLKDTMLSNIKQEVAKSGTKVSEDELKKDVETLLKNAKAEVLSYSFYKRSLKASPENEFSSSAYKDGYYINVAGKALKSFWDKRGPQLKQSMDTFKIN